MQVHIKRCVLGSEDNVLTENGDHSHLAKPLKPLLWKKQTCGRFGRYKLYPKTCDLLLVF